MKRGIEQRTPRMWPLHLALLGVLLAWAYVLLRPIWGEGRITAAAQLTKTMFIGIVLEAFPYVLLGVVVSALIHVLVPDQWIRRIVPRHPLLAVLVACTIGIVLPVCECGMVPIVRRLLAKGLPLYAGVTFLLAGPIVNPVVYAATMAAFRATPEMVYARMGLAVAVSITVGLLVAVLVRGNPLRMQPALAASVHAAACTHAPPAPGAVVPAMPIVRIGQKGQQPPADAAADRIFFSQPVRDAAGAVAQQYGVPPRSAHVSSAHESSTHQVSVHERSAHAVSLRTFRSASLSWRTRAAQQLHRILRHIGEECFEMGKYVLLGALLTALVQTFVPRPFLLDIGQSGVGSYSVMMGLAYLLSLCSTSDAFVAVSFTSMFSAGSLLAFLVYGPMIDLKGTLMLLAAFRTSFVWLLIGLVTVAVLLGSMLVAALYIG